MRPAIMIPDGVSARNFAFGSFLECVRSYGPALVLYAPPLKDIVPAEATSGTHWAPLLPYREDPIAFTLRYALGDAHMYWGNSFAMRAILRRPIEGSWRTRAVRNAARVLGRLFATPRGIRALSRTQYLTAARNDAVKQYAEIFKQRQVSILFCAHQRPPEVLPAVLAARSLDIPTVTFINSWDNISSKGRIAAPFDHYLVWGTPMRNDMLRYYPDVSPDRVHVVGSPQFDPYSDNGLVCSREQFFSEIRADHRRPLICYSGGDRRTCPEDPLHLRILLEAIRDGRIHGQPQVLLRPAPVDRGDRYNTVRADFPELIYSAPAWSHPTEGSWSDVVPVRDDVRFLVNLTRHTSLNVNMASTMTLDFALNDTPVVNIAFDASDPPRLGVPVSQYYYRFEHYQPVVQLGAARIAQSPSEFCDQINRYLECPALERDARERFVELEVGVPPGHSSSTIADILNRISADSVCTSATCAMSTHPASMAALAH